MKISMKHLKLIPVLLVMMLILITPALAVEDNYREITSQSDVQLDKPNWSIQFSLPIAETSLNENNIFIIKQEDQTRHPIKLELSQDKKTLYVIPQRAYDAGTTYRLFIEEGIRSNTSPAYNLTKKTAMTFLTIKSSTPGAGSGPNKSQTAPTGLVGVPPTYFGDKDGKITGVNDTMEYRAKGNRNYTLVTASTTEITSLRAGLYEVRYRAKTGYDAGTVAEVTVADGPPKGGIVTDLDPQTLADLQVVSKGLEKVIAQLATAEEKGLAQIIKNNIDSKIADPTFDHTAQISEVRAHYNALSKQQRTKFQDAVLYNIPVQRLMRLADFFGF